MIKRRIIDFHSHLGDIFHENKNISFKAPMRFETYSDPFEELAKDTYCRALVTEDQEAQNVLIDAGQFRTWEYGGLIATQKALDENNIDFADPFRYCRTQALKKLLPPLSLNPG